MRIKTTDFVLINFDTTTAAPSNLLVKTEPYSLFDITKFAGAGEGIHPEYANHNQFKSSNSERVIQGNIPPGDFSLISE
jgi:hypothetical protein